ncbi:uncharacterized protein METZ01_LOCUS369496 [marine metagenome]|uniref:Sec-independent protein translocase protein TatC n=1 Tax=marine metagenome TaxID=408172 RepID=A0A382T4B5_9ZZZZ
MTSDTSISESGHPRELTDEEPPEDTTPREEMTLIEHLLELRTRVMWSAIAVTISTGALLIPTIGFEFIELMLEPARAHDPQWTPQSLGPLDRIVTLFKVALLGGIALAMPVLIYQTMRFVTPALTKKEKRWVLPIVIGGSIAFLGGLAFAYFVVLPLSLVFLLSFGDSWARDDWQVSLYIDFVTRMMLILGIAFETPLIVMGMAKLGVVTSRKLLGWWRWAILGAFLGSAIVTPTIDPVTQSLVAGPVIVLYFVGVGLAWLVRGKD